MAHLITIDGKTPQIAPDAFIAPTAVLIGDVTIEAGASVLFGAVLRADFDRIVVGSGSNIQDNSVVHTASGLATIVGANVTVGHMALLEGCVIEDGVLIGMGSIVLNRAKIGGRSVIAAGSVVKEDMVIPPRVLAAGVPAVVKRGLDDKGAERGTWAAGEYQHLRLRYLRQGIGYVHEEA